MRLSMSRNEFLIHRGGHDTSRRMISPLRLLVVRDTNMLTLTSHFFYFLIRSAIAWLSSQTEQLQSDRKPPLISVFNSVATVTWDLGLCLRCGSAALSGGSEGERGRGETKQ